MTVLPPLIAGIDVGGSKIACAYLQGNSLVVDAYSSVFSHDRAKRLYNVCDHARRFGKFHQTNYFFIEEPLVGRGIRASLQVAQMAGAFMLMMERVRYTDMMLVPVGTWKKLVVGLGNADKMTVSDWLEQNYPEFYEICGGNQDLIDATCIALYGAEIVAQSRSAELLGANEQLHQ